MRSAAFTLAFFALPAAGRSDDAFTKTAQPFLAKFCASCHKPEKKTADVDVTRFATQADAAKEPLFWEQLAGRVRATEMPPDGAKMPEHAERQKFLDWTKTVVPKSDCQKLATDQTQNFYKGHVMSRRLGRAEYDNTVRDLVGLDVPRGLIVPGRRLRRRGLRHVRRQPVHVADPRREVSEGRRSSRVGRPRRRQAVPRRQTRGGQGEVARRHAVGRRDAAAGGREGADGVRRAGVPPAGREGRGRAAVGPVRQSDRRGDPFETASACRSRPH